MSYENYADEVKVEIYPADGRGFVDDVVVTLDYSIEMETRSWGVKSIYPMFRDVIEINAIQTLPTGEEVDLLLSCDLARLEVEWTKGAHYMPETIQLYLNDENEVDYSRSRIEFNYIDHNR